MSPPAGRRWNIWSTGAMWKSQSRWWWTSYEVDVNPRTVWRVGSGSSPQMKGSPAHLLRLTAEESRPHFLQVCAESILCCSIPVWHSSYFAAEKSQHVVMKDAQKVVGATLPTNVDIYTCSYRKKATCIVRYSTHPAHTGWPSPQAGSCRVPGADQQDWGTASTLNL